jgi:toxin-antitoxin system PIN domain toxin
MPLVDSSVWIALALSKHAHNAHAGKWLSSVTRRDPALFCRSTQQTFLRLLTTQAVLAAYGVPALSNQEAWKMYQALVDDPRIAWVEEPQGLEPIWKKLASKAQASPKLWNDAYLAAFAIAGSHRFVTTDKGFKQFKELDVLVLT